MVTAYLLVKLERNADVIDVIEVGVFDTAEPTQVIRGEHPQAWATVLTTTAEDFETARAGALASLETTPWLSWLSAKARGWKLI